MPTDFDLTVTASPASGTADFDLGGGPVMKTLTATVGLTASFVRSVLRVRPVGVSLAPSFLRQLARPLSVTSATTATTARTKVLLKVLSVTSATVVALQRTIQRTRSAAVGAAATFSRLIGKPFTVVMGAAPTIARGGARTLTTTVALTASRLRQAALTPAVALTAGATASRVKFVSRALTASAAASAALLKALPRALVAGATLAASIAAAGARFRTLAAAATAGGVLSRTISRVRVSTVSLLPLYNRRVKKEAAAVVTGSAHPVGRSHGRIASATVAATAVSSRFLRLSVTARVVVFGRVTRFFSQALAASTSVLGSMLRAPAPTVLQKLDLAARAVYRGITWIARRF